MSFKHKRSKEQNKEYIQKTYSLILYPNKNQEGILARFFGASRYLYNKGLELKIEAYKESKQSLTYRDLAKFLNLARSIQNASWNQFVQVLTYKAVWRGKTVEKIPMLYPSSRLCNRCDYKNHELKLKDRAWICLNCGANHDRDINAAVNIRNYREGNSRINASGEGKLVKALVERRNPVELQKLGSEARKCFQGIVT